MNWLTTDQINEAAKTVDTAMDCSVKHWRQLATATFRECVGAVEKYELPHRKFCSLCTLYWGSYGIAKSTDCVKCPVYKFSGRYCNNSPYSTAWRAWRRFRNNRTLSIYRKFHTAANREYRFLLKVRKWWKEQK
jgi:hypothetical protein